MQIQITTETDPSSDSNLVLDSVWAGHASTQRHTGTYEQDRGSRTGPANSRTRQDKAGQSKGRAVAGGMGEFLNFLGFLDEV